MSYNFKEMELGPDFCKKYVQEIKRLIGSSVTFSVVGMPAMGISIFLRYLATQPFAYFVHIDIYELPRLTRIDLFQLLARELGVITRTETFQQLIEVCKKRLEQLSKAHKRIVIIFNRFDQLKREFDESFFNNLRALRDVSKEKIVMIFAANKPLYELAWQTIDIGNMNMYSYTFYLKPYSEKDLIKLIALNAPDLQLKKSTLKKILAFSGGHYQLFQLLIKSQRVQSPLLDHFVISQFKQLYEFLNYSQRKQLQKIALGKKIDSINEYLLNSGIVNKKMNNYQLFTPLFTEFLRSRLPVKLSLKEATLFQLLKKNLGKVVAKDEIFEAVWPEDPLEASEWALNALIYRLRKNPAVIEHDYTIESHKKIGYSLTKT